MNCPLCDKPTLTFQRDCIAIYPIVDGKINDAVEDINYLDNSWLECTSCNRTSDDSETLANLYDTVVNQS